MCRRLWCNAQGSKIAVSGMVCGTCVASDASNCGEMFDASVSEGYNNGENFGKKEMRQAAFYE